MQEYAGAIHIHSRFSDGSGEIPEIASLANEAGLDFIILTDHNTLRGLTEGYERFYGETLCLVGCEINDKENKNHYLAMGIEKTFSTRMPAKEFVRAVKESGGIGFLAHPFEKRDSMKEHPPYPWTEWDCDEYTGIEIWNHMSEWMENLTEQNKYQAFMHPLKSIAGPTKEALTKWDEESMKRKVVGIGGIDAHAHRVNLLGFFEVEVFPYKVLFKSIRTHVLTHHKLDRKKGEEGVKKGKSMIYEALREGRCFVSNYYHGDATGFRFFAEEGKNVYQMGDKVKLTKNLKLRVEVPEVVATIRVIRNGELYAITEGLKGEYEVSEGGMYRTEIFVNKKAWIFSNHIRIE
ncbi:MAG: PHP domain-containing protein [Ignavibacteriales bacterium]|jgi:hypothetical protein|nr:PHP domain-containing protein [Ignavibacteriaceae bacterium]NLH61452.1 PHP domain-containing protein [Ignavibacteriales bacterium]HPO55282.1 PHP domain-containing protein [Ignavibacteriaceae bacterium]